MNRVEMETGPASGVIPSGADIFTVCTSTDFLVGGDLTHAWDGRLFAILAAGVTWPILNALGIFN